MKDKSFHQATPKRVLVATVLTILIANGYAYSEVTVDDSTVSVTDTMTNPVEPSPSHQPISTSKPSVTTSDKPVEISFSVDYTVPGNKRNGLDISLVTQDDVVISVDTVHRSIDKDSAGHIRIFDQGVQEQAVGRTIEELEDILIARASLTTEAFKAGIRTSI